MDKKMIVEKLVRGRIEEDKYCMKLTELFGQDACNTIIEFTDWYYSALTNAVNPLWEDGFWEDIDEACCNFAQGNPQMVFYLDPEDSVPYPIDSVEDFVNYLMIKYFEPQT